MSRQGHVVTQNITKQGKNIFQMIIEFVQDNALTSRGGLDYPSWKTCIHIANKRMSFHYVHFKRGTLSPNLS